VKPEEIEALFRELRAKVEAGTISEDKFEAELGEFLFQDESGTYWTVGAQTQNWYRHEKGDWVRASPPSSLNRARAKEQEFRAETPAVPSGRRDGLKGRVVLGVLGLVFGACLVVAGVLYYQLGRPASTSVPATHSPTATTSVTSTPSPEPTAPTPSIAATALPMKVGSPTPRASATPQAPSPTPPRPTATPEAAPSETPAPTQVFAHSAPVLVLPEDGTDRGPGYGAWLIWKPVDNLGDDEYYHVEVCWNECTMHEAGTVRDTTWQFPEFRRGQSIDDKYYWHVTVRQQRGAAPDGLKDPATSPPSETWMFTFPEK
jgi:hypothetical protein